jgi:hypothetical protein
MDFVNSLIKVQGIKGWAICAVVAIALPFLWTWFKRKGIKILVQYSVRFLISQMKAKGATNSEVVEYIKGIDELFESIDEELDEEVKTLENDGTTRNAIKED